MADVVNLDAFLRQSAVYRPTSANELAEINTVLLSDKVRTATLAHQTNLTATGIYQLRQKAPVAITDIKVNVVEALKQYVLALKDAAVWQVIEQPGKENN